MTPFYSREYHHFVRVGAYFRPNGSEISDVSYCNLAERNARAAKIRSLLREKRLDAALVYPEMDAILSEDAR